MNPYPLISSDLSTSRDRYERQLRLMEVAKKISLAGIRFNDDLAKTRIQEAEVRAAEYTDQFLEETGLPSSALGESGEGKTKAVRDYYWNTLGAPQLMHNKRSKAAQFNTPLLIEYTKRLHPDKGGDAAICLLGARAAKKTIQFLNTYRLFAQAGDGYIYGGFDSKGTKGERWSSSAKLEIEGRDKPLSLNLQNIPGKGFSVKRYGREWTLAEGQRDLFMPPPGCSWLKFDYDAQEARLLAYISKARNLRDWITGKKDMHILNALSLLTELNLPDYDTFKANKDTDPKLTKARNAAKTIMYAFAYQFAKGNGHDMYVDSYKAMVKDFPSFSQKYVNQLAPRYFRLHPEIRDLQQTVRQSVDENGYIEHPLFGGRLFVQAALDDTRGYNQGINYLMQSGGGHVFNLAVLRVAPLMTWTRAGTGILALVHDEIDAWCPHGDEKKTATMIKDAMGAPFDLYGERVSLPAEASWGQNWGTLKKLKN